MSIHLLLFVVFSLTRPAGARAACQPRETGIVVRVHTHGLDLCEEGRPVASHRVALGSGGIGKRTHGDNKTPLGLYALGTPRTSQQFGTFVPVGYPTPAQQKLGFTGSAVGIHGPPRGVGGVLSTSVDWTAGCIAVGSDAEIQAIAAWIRRHHIRAVRIE
jgi:L,D-peptidoglycan transpeptidase YkuD (ErfK/YbiS/YcfS/YnhG family)